MCSSAEGASPPPKSRMGSRVFLHPKKTMLRSAANVNFQSRRSYVTGYPRRVVNGSVALICLATLTPDLSERRPGPVDPWRAAFLLATFAVRGIAFGPDLTRKQRTIGGRLKLLIGDYDDEYYARSCFLSPFGAYCLRHARNSWEMMSPWPVSSCLETSITGDLSRRRSFHTPSPVIVCFNPLVG